MRKSFLNIQHQGGSRRCETDLCNIFDRCIHDKNTNGRLEYKSCESKENLTTVGYKHNTAALQRDPFSRHVTET